MRKIFIGLLIMTIPLMYGCKEKMVKYEDSGSTVHLNVGQMLKVELPGNVSTGNSWRKVEYDDRVISRMGKPAYKSTDDRVGSSGLYYFTFKASAPGTTKLYMEYGSKYDEMKEAVKTFELEIIVAGG